MRCLLSTDKKVLFTSITNDVTTLELLQQFNRLSYKVDRLEFMGENVQPPSSYYQFASQRDIGLETLKEFAIFDGRITSTVFRDVKFVRCSFAGTNFRSCTFDECTFEDCSFASANFEKCFFVKCDFIGELTRFIETKFDRTTFTDCVFVGWSGEQKDSIIELNDKDLLMSNTLRIQPTFLKAKLKNTVFEVCNLQGVGFFGIDSCNVSMVSCSSTLASVNNEPRFGISLHNICGTDRINFVNCYSSLLVTTTDTQDYKDITNVIGNYPNPSVIFTDPLIAHG